MSGEPYSIEWRSLDWLPNYEISEDGRVRRNGNEIYQLANKSGHRQCCPWVNGKQIKCWVHRLVCEAWHGRPPFPKAEAAHNDGNPANNHYTNLRWATHKENQADRVKHGTHTRGEHHPRAKLTWADVHEIRTLANTVSRAELARLYGISKGHLNLIIRGGTWAERRETEAA